MMRRDVTTGDAVGMGVALPGFPSSLRVYGGGHGCHKKLAEKKKAVAKEGCCESLWKRMKSLLRTLASQKLRVPSVLLS
ncbi:hypothetical protein HAX54_043727 [Datura stramonium]|uniref:Uncharacterized protein n=1 Tax=Datura stramonium TaxID=4076 RepID=A0ABS8W2Z2_DATST|nr:hypothetical protein [Datura stramonium]